MAKQPIGIFDSGLGGLTVFREVKKLLPSEDIVYFGDTARVPYGTKSRETVIKFSIQNADFLVNLNVKMIIVACNTSSSHSLPALKRRHNLPIIGVIKPGVQGAVNAVRNMRIAVIGTRSTISSGAYGNEIKKLNPKIETISISCPLFVPLVEEGWLKGYVTKAIAKQYLAPIKEKNIDTVVLGCTHYPLLKPIIRAALGKDVTLIDSAAETAIAVKRIIYEKGINDKEKGRGKHRFYVSDEPKLFKRIAARFLGGRITNVRKIDIGG